MTAQFGWPGPGGSVPVDDHGGLAYTGIMASYGAWVAEQVVAAEQQAGVAATLRAVTDTLVQAAAWIKAGRPDRVIQAAHVMSTLGPDGWWFAQSVAVYCPLCHSAVCDPGCALALVRAAIPQLRGRHDHAGDLPVIITDTPPDLDDPEIRRRLRLHGEVHIPNADQDLT